MSSDRSYSSHFHSQSSTNEWAKVKFKDYVLVKARIGWKGLKKSEFGSEGYIIINGPNIMNGKVHWASCERVPEWRYFESKEISVLGEDILLTKDGTIGKVAFIDKLEEPATLASGIFLIRPKDKSCLNARYLYAYLSSRSFKNLVNERIEGSVVPHLYQRDLEEIEFKLPRMAEQKIIAKIFFNLETKIELNNQMNKTLESIAQALFKHWFIDFEFPDENGRPYKSSGGEMVETDYGSIPEGWRYVRLKEILSNLESGSRPKGGATSSGVPSIGAENIIGLGIYDFHSTKYVPIDFYNKMKDGKVQDFDVLLYKDGAQIGRKSMFALGFPFEEFCVNEHVFILRTNETLNQYYLYFWLALPDITETIVNLNANSAQPGINKQGVSNIPILLPKKDLIDRFRIKVEPLMKSIFLNSKESHTISEIRDILLPKLISGKIRVPVED